MKKFDVIIIGGGPVGLCFAASIATLGLQIAIIEQQSLQNLSSPACDGRDIAITHASRTILTNAGIWQHIPANAISEIHQAKVLNGRSPYTLDFNADDVGEEKLAFIVSNHLIRQAAFENLKKHNHVTLITDVKCISASTNEQAALITLSNGVKLTSHLLVAADSRFSSIRQQMGISASIHDFGKTMIVCQMEIEKAHNNIAYECFYYGRTLAALPLCNNTCSIVMTVPPQKSDDFMTMNAERFNTKIERMLSFKFGKMNLISKRYPYPLVGVYSNKFIGKCFALLGDAAVGMHPVTAHGFNFGVKGQYLLANEIKNAVACHRPIGSHAGLIRYEKQHIKATKPLYIATTAIAKLFTNDTLPSKCLRKIFLKAANDLTPMKKLLLSTLTEKI